MRNYCSFILGALNKSKTKKGELSYAINDLGRTMTNFGISPRFAKMLALSNQHVTSKNSSSKNMLPYVVALVSAFTVREMFVNPSNLGNQKELAEKLDGASRKARNRLIRETMKKWQGSPNMRGLGELSFAEIEFAGNIASLINLFSSIYKFNTL